MLLHLKGKHSIIHAPYEVYNEAILQIAASVNSQKYFLYYIPM